MKCPQCEGEGGFFDYFGEYDECSLCKETGQISRWRKVKWWFDMKVLDFAIKKECKRLEKLESDKAAK